MQIYGYHRTSTKEQHLDRGIQEIERYCNEHEMALTNIFTDQETGKNFNRPRYTVLVEDVLRLGDILIVTELDRLGRNKHDTMQQIQRIKDMGVRLMVLELPTTLMDLSVMDNAMARMMLETINNMMLELYASMAQAELEKKEKRQREGIEAKKLRGEWDDYGRPSVMKQETFDENFQSVISGKMTPSAVLLIKNGQTKLVNIKNQDTVTKILDMIPDIVDKFTQPKEKEGMSDAEVVDIAFPEDGEKPSEDK